MAHDFLEPPPQFIRQPIILEHLRYQGIAILRNPGKRSRQIQGIGQPSRRNAFQAIHEQVESDALAEDRPVAMGKG